MKTVICPPTCVPRAWTRRPAVSALSGLWVLASMLAGCASRKPAPEPPAPPPAVAREQGDDDRAEELGRELERCRADAEAARAELAQARDELRGARQQTAQAEARYQALRRETDRVLDDVLASKASLRGVNNRALAISRIAEVRVQMQSARAKRSLEVAGRLRDADALLTRADRTLEEGNYGGAAYLADRAAEVISQAQADAEAASRQTSQSADPIPIVPPRTVEVAVVANLRSGPDITKRQVGQAKPGTKLRAVARLGDWLQVETDDGGTAWIHRSTLR